MRPKFVADVAGTYIAQLIVDDGHGAATAATVVATSEASRPIADAGADPLGRAGAAVALNGTGSVDPKAGSLAASWTILGLGDQPTVGALSAPASLTTNFNVPPAGVPLTQAVFIEPAALPLAKGEQENGGPRGVDLDSVGRITKDGTPYTVWRIRNVTKNGRVATLDSEGTTFSVTLTIPAKSDLFVVSPIVAGTATHRLMANGQVYEVVDALATAFADARLVGGGPALKLSIVQLVVANDLLFDVDDVVVSTVEARPVSVLGATTPAHRGGLVQLDGSASLHPNAPAAIYSGLSYKWALLSRPAGSHATLSDPTAAIASFTPDAYGRYVAQLIVSDGKLSSRPRTVVVDVAARKPIAAASAASPVAIGQVATLDGSGSIDPDGNALSYAWTLIARPAGSNASLSFATAAIASLTPDLAGTYVAELVVSDAYGASAPASVSVVAQGGLAFTTPIGPQQVPLGGSLAFTIRAVDPTGKPVVYSIAGGLPAGASFDAASGAFKFRPASNNPASQSFVFHATNGKDVATMTVPVTVTGEPSGTLAALSAKIYDAVDYANGTPTPVVGAIVTSEGLSATSGAGGDIAFAGLSPGQTTLVISAAGAAPAPDGSRYLDSITSASLIAGVTNTLDGPILLARSSGGTGVNPGGATTVANSALNVSLTIPANSAFNADGTPYAGEISIGSLPSDTPAGLPAGFAPCQLLVISPAGVTFSPPAKLTVANRDQLPAGALVDLWAFDPQLASARVVGIGKVSTDGATIATEIGGVPGGSVVAMTPRRVGLAQTKMQPTDIFVPSVLGGGDLATSFSPPGTRQLNAGRGLTFVYHSMTADARPVIDAKAQLGPGQGLPQTLTTRLTVGGVTQQTVLSTNLATPIAGAAPLDPTKQNAVIQAGIADANSLSSGAHPYSFLTISKYACSTVGSQTTGSFVVNNQSKSPFGAGWQLAETQKLEKQSDGSVTIVEGNGRALIHHGSQAPDFLPDPVYIPVNGPFLGAVADMSGDGRPSLLRLGWKDGTLNAILNRGDRRFVKSSVLTVGQPGTQNANGTLSLDITDIAAGDINGDGAADAALITSRTSQAKIYYGASGGVFLPSPVQVESNTTGGNVVIGDWIGNKITHLMMSEGAGGYPDFHVILNDGRGSLVFKHDAPRLPGDPLAMATVRFPGFAHDSVAGLTSDGTIGWAYGGAIVGAWYDKAYTRGVGSTEMYPAGPLDFDELLQDGLRVPTPVRQTIGGRYLAAGDIDGTGYPSFAVAAVSAVYIVKWRGPGANNQKIAQTLTLPGGLAPDSVTLAPLAKGDRPSLIVTANTAGFYVFTNDGRGNFSSTPVFIPTPFRVGIEADVVDFDGDGVSDIALNDIDNDRVAIYFGKPHPTGAFVAPIGDYTRLVKNANGTYSRIYNDGTVVAFNGEGFQTSITDANGNVTSYSYSSQGQLLSIADPTGATTSFTYSGAFLASTTDGSGRTTSFEHDGAGNLTKVIDPLGAVTQYLYDANHQLIATIDPNGGNTSNEFTATGQLKKQTYPDGASVLLDASRALGLDALGVDLGGPLSAAFVPESARITRMQDAKGNLSETEVNEWGAVTRVNAYQWSMDGELTHRAPKSGGAAWRFFHSFHPAENMMRLDLAQGSDGKEIGFFYDPFQRLVARHWPGPRGNDELYYDGPDIALERRAPSTGGTQWVRYVHGPGTDQPLAMEVYPFNASPTPGTGSQFYYHADGEGSIRLLTDASGQIANRYDYDSFGRRLAVTESLPNQPYGWKAREWFPEGELYYNRARWYDPVLGRFTSEDPIGYGGGDFNLYSFAWNNPKNWNDPSGPSG